MQTAIASGPPRDWWSPPVRLLVFVLAASSIWCLLAEFYGLCSMRVFTWCVSLPALVALGGLGAADQWRGTRRLSSAMRVGASAGLLAAVAYDLFRLPFVFARPWGITGVVPSMPLYKVFPQFGVMMLGQPVGSGPYSAAAHLAGWAYHFSNGLTFGIMYLAVVGDSARRTWVWAVVMAVGLELGMLFTPYPGTFGIAVTPRFVVVTLVAHLIFGVVLGLTCRQLAARWW